jgi:hypothetical protein
MIKEETKTETVPEAAMRFAKARLVFTDDCVDYDKVAHAGFIEGARFILKREHSEALEFKDKVMEFINSYPMQYARDATNFIDLIDYLKQLESEYSKPTK